MAAAGLGAATARAEAVAVVVVPPFPPAAYAARGAVGLFVPGSGPSVTRAAALASLVRGKVENSVLGGVPSGPPLIALAKKPAPVTVYVALPPPGSRPNTHRYPIAIVGGGYQGLLTSRSTRIPGLVSIADIAPTARALAAGKRPVIRARPDADAPADLARLDQRMSRAHSVRLAATIILVLTVLTGALLALLLRSEYVARAGLLTVPALLASSLLLSAAGVTAPSWLVELLLALLTVAGSAAIAISERLLLPALLALIASYLVVLIAWPEVNSFAAIGPHPDGGGRFYGSTNLTSGVLLSVSLLAGMLVGPRRAWLVAVLALITVGWSRAGADGGGLVMIAAAFLVLVARLSRRPLTPRLLGLVAAGAVAGVLVLIGLDAATGGSSHVTRAVGKGPDALAGDLGHRLHISYASVTSSWHTALVFAVSIGALVVLATRRPHFAAGEALLVGIAISLLVNDTPTDVAPAGALSYGVLWAWQRLRTERLAQMPPVTVATDVPGVSSRA